MLITRCPHCLTSFRIRPEQLNLRGGRVRCGHCQTPFSALASLDEMPEDVANARVVSQAANEEAAPAPIAQPASTVPLNRETAQEEEDFDLDFDLGTEQEAAESGAVPASDTPDAVEHVSAEAFEPDADDGIEHSFSELVEDEEQADDGESVPQLHTIFLDEETQPKLDPAARARTRRRLILGNAILLLSGILLAAYVLRIQLASHYPQLREPLERACASLGCDVPYLRDDALILLDGNELTPVPGKQNNYNFAFTLRNTAGFPIAWPQIDLTLTDRYERSLTRRVLEPGEWLPAEYAQRPAFPAQGELTAHIVLASDVQVMGYRVGVFYR